MSNRLSDLLAVISTGDMVRGSGMAAYVLLFFIVFGGLILSLQWVPARQRTNYLTYHRLISFSALAMLLLHGLAFFIDKYAFVSWMDVLIPFWTQHKTLEIATGIIALYTMAALVLTSYRSVMKAIGYENWRATHYLAFPCFILSFYHGAMLSKSGNTLFLSWIYPATASIVISLLLMRVWKLVERRRPANENSAG